MKYNATYIEKMERILEAILAVNSEKDYFKLLDTILTKMMEISDADAGTLYILEDNKLHFRIIRNISLNIFRGAYDKIDLPPITLDPGNITNVCAYAAIKNKPLAIDDVYASTEFNFDGPKRYDKRTGYRTQSMLTLPLTATEDGADKVIGVMQLLNSTDRAAGTVKPFEDVDDPPLLPSLASISANALANLLHAKEIKELLNSFVRVMSKAIDERSPYNVDHANNVAASGEKFVDYLSSRFACPHEFHFTEGRREQFIMAALLHDIGKIITPLEIMDKPDRLGRRLEAVNLKFEVKKYQLKSDYLGCAIGEHEYKNKTREIGEALALIEYVNTSELLSDDKLEQVKKLKEITYLDEKGEPAPLLTPSDINALSIRRGTLTRDEYGIMQEHVAVTSRLLAEMNFSRYYKDVKRWAENHHELLDGSGYPHGLSGDDLSTEMCILTILDMYDALTAHDRPYKRAMTHEKAVDILKLMAKAGKLHEELLDLFIESKLEEVPHD